MSSSVVSSYPSTDSDAEKGLGSQQSFTNTSVTSVVWQDLCVDVKGKGGAAKRILHEVSGLAVPGQMTGLLGASGSGKTTLLNYLASRKLSGGTASQTGSVLVNGATQSRDILRDVSAFVEQEYALIGSLTAEETLLFAGRLAVPHIGRAAIKARADELITAFGLVSCRNTLIGTPIQKGLSGGQKKRVSVACQLMTGSQILFLDEPTSGLDSTASFEVMSFLKRVVVKYNLVAIASIHQPSTKTFELFDKICLLSVGTTCYFGTRAHLAPYFSSINLPIPALTNPAEHILDVVNTDFNSPIHGDNGAPTDLERVKSAWAASDLHKAVLFDIESHKSSSSSLSATKSTKANFFSALLTLVHRGFIKSVRDVVAYWIRLVMYTGLAILMGTVWLRLSPDQNNIQPYINAIFFGSAFMSFMAVAYVPAYLEDRASYVKERANGLYGPLVFNLSNFIVGVPYLFAIALVFSLISYWLINLRPSGSAFFTWVMWLYLDLLAAESIVVFFASLFPNFVLSLALIAFANGLWMSVGGFLVPTTILNVFWRYVFHYIDYQAYVFQGMMVNEFADRTYSCGAGCRCLYDSPLASQCEIAGTAVLGQYGYPTGRTGKWVGILVAITVVYRLFAQIALWAKKN